MSSKQTGNQHKRRQQVKGSTTLVTKDLRKQMLSEALTSKGTMITRRKVVETKEKISEMSSRTLRMMQRANMKRSSIGNTVEDERSYTGQMVDSRDNLVVGTVENAPEESENMKSTEAPSNESKQMNRVKRNASQAALQAIGKIARFEQMTNNNKSLSNSSLSKMHRGISDKESACLSFFQESKATKMVSTNDVSNLYNISVPVPKLPSMINGKVQLNEEDNDVLTEYSYINNTFDCIDINSLPRFTEMTSKSHN